MGPASESMADSQAREEFLLAQAVVGGTSKRKFSDYELHEEVRRVLQTRVLQTRPHQMTSVTLPEGATFGWRAPRDATLPVIGHQAMTVFPLSKGNPSDANVIMGSLSDDMLAKLGAGKVWFETNVVDRPIINVFGPKAQARRVQVLGVNAYKYSGRMHPAMAMPEWLEEVVLEVANRVGFGVAMPAGFRFATPHLIVLANLYEKPLPDYDGKFRTVDTIGWHADSEDGLCEGASILSISVGQPRVFEMRARERGIGDNGIVFSKKLAHGTVLAMRGARCQADYEHHLGNLPMKERVAAGSRLNITLRLVKGWRV
jgi:hypothetical protein